MREEKFQIIVIKNVVEKSTDVLRRKAHRKLACGANHRKTSKRTLHAGGVAENNILAALFQSAKYLTLRNLWFAPQANLRRAFGT